MSVVQQSLVLASQGCPLDLRRRCEDGLHLDPTVAGDRYEHVH
jgi:hypothetical protein